MTKPINEFVESISWFEYEGSYGDDKTYMFATRKHGDMANELYGLKDALEANHVKKEVLKNYNAKIEIDYVDEFVLINITEL